MRQLFGFWLIFEAITCLVVYLMAGLDFNIKDLIKVAAGIGAFLTVLMGGIYLVST